MISTALAQRNGAASGKAAEESDAFVVKLNPATGVIQVVGSGFWTPQDVDRHFGKLGDVVRSVRQSGRQIRVLVNLSGVPPQSLETVERIGVASARIYAKEDRIAIIVDSSLAKMQMRRVVREAQHQIFLSPNAAMTWLGAFG
ncbi:MAG TPA: hypothetical protein VF509_08225 [Sphingobium sp.]